MITQILGTNRTDSNTARLGRFVQKIYEKHGVALDNIDLKELPNELFQPSAYAEKPPSFKPMTDKVLNSKGLLIIAPEYNGSFPGILKYFIDMLPFPESFEDRPVAFIGLAAGEWGSLRSVEQLQGIFSYRNAYIYPKRVFIPGAMQKFDAEGNFNDSKIVDLIEQQTAGFIDFIKCLKG